MNIRNLAYALLFTGIGCLLHGLVLPALLLGGIGALILWAQGKDASQN